MIIAKAPTTLVIDNMDVDFSTVAQSITLNATITSNSGTINQGTVTFTVRDSAKRIVGGGTAVVSNNRASVTFNLRPGLPRGFYMIAATYKGIDLLGTSGTSMLTVN